MKRLVIALALLLTVFTGSTLHANTPASSNLNPYSSNLIFSEAECRASTYISSIGLLAIIIKLIRSWNMMEKSGGQRQTRPWAQNPAFSRPWVQITGQSGGSGSSITSGTADPTGGADGDAYVQVDGSDEVQSIWRNISGTWTEFTIPLGQVVGAGLPCRMQLRELLSDQVGMMGPILRRRKVIINII